MRGAFAIGTGRGLVLTGEEEKKVVGGMLEGFGTVLDLIGSAFYAAHSIGIC